MQTDSMTRGTRSKTRESITSGAQFLSRELLREPVREAVREALREEALAVRPADSGGDRPNTDGRTSTAEWSGDDGDRSSNRGSGRSKLAMVLGLVALVGVTMFVRRKRRSSDQSDLSSFDEGGAGGFGRDTGDAGGSTSATRGAGEREESGASSTSPTE